MKTRLTRLLVGLGIVLAGFSACSRPQHQFGEKTPATIGGASGAGGDGGASSTETCSPGDQRCNGLLPERCSESGDWLATQASCAVACFNAECVGCTEGATTCKDGAVQKCTAGAWTTQQVCPKACEGDSCVDACTEGLLQCNGGHSLQKCTGGAFVDDTACDFLCSGGACVGTCVPDDKRCNPDAPSEAQVCNTDGEWAQSTPCADGTFCVSGACGACMPGTSRCSAAGPQLCSDAGQWVNQGPCIEPNAACFGGKCVTCNPGDKRCTGQNVEQCAADGSGWALLATCSGATPACLANTKTCGKCAQGDTQCLGNAVQTCDDQSLFQTTKTCSGSTPSCTGGKCSECDPASAQRRCASPASTQSCSATGAWAPATDCAGDTPLCRDDLGFKCGCKEDARRCRNSTVPEVCQGGAWVAQSACSGTLDYCLPATGQCVDCVPQKAECMGGIAYQCSDAGAFVSLNSCSGPGINCGNCGVGDACGKNADCATGFCVSGKCAVCDPGSRGCVGATPRLCSTSGAWTNQTSCTGTTPECLPSTGQCVACLGTATRSCGNCNTGTQTCSNNAWGACVGAVDLNTSKQYCGNCTTSCSASQLCENGSCVVDCGTKTRCGTSCVNLATDTSNCLMCGTKCSPPAANGSAVCTATGCDISCTNTRCGTSCCTATPSGSTAGCSGNTCTFTCSSGNHGCSSSTAPCYGNTDGSHCGSSCLDCSKYVGTTGACSSSACTCEASSSLACGAAVPTCGSWDFNSGKVEGWRYGDYYDSTNHRWLDAAPGTTTTNGSPALSARYDGVSIGYGTVEFETDLCPNGAILNLSTYKVDFDYYFLTTGGGPFGQDPEDGTDSFMANGTMPLLGCQLYTDPGSDMWIHASCSNLPSSMTNLTIIFRLGTPWAGTVFLDNITLTPK